MSIQDETVEFANPLFLVGRNSSGKSNFIEAFEFVADYMAMPLQMAYQAALTAQFDMAQTYRRCSSFRKLVKELCRVLEAAGHIPAVPEGWHLTT